jgi:hypothetical protein
MMTRCFAFSCTMLLRTRPEVLTSMNVMYVATQILLQILTADYPGSNALALLNERYADSASGRSTLLPSASAQCADRPTNERACVHVHVANLAAQSGASLFFHTHAPPDRERIPLTASATYHPWVYNKTENLTPADSRLRIHIHACNRGEQGRATAHWAVGDRRCHIWVRRVEGSTAMYWGL